MDNYTMIILGNNSQSKQKHYKCLPASLLAPSQFEGHAGSYHSLLLTENMSQKSEKTIP